MAKNYEIDDVDLKILSHLMLDAKTPYTEIAKNPPNYRIKIILFSRRLHY